MLRATGPRKSCSPHQAVHGGSMPDWLPGPARVAVDGAASWNTVILNHLPAGSGTGVSHCSQGVLDGLSRHAVARLGDGGEPGAAVLAPGGVDPPAAAVDQIPDVDTTELKSRCSATLPSIWDLTQALGMPARGSLCGYTPRS
jgi:hypothetical protein